MSELKVLKRFGFEGAHDRAVCNEELNLDGEKGE